MMTETADFIAEYATRLFVSPLSCFFNEENDSATPLLPP